MLVIHTENLTKHYGRRIGVDDVNLDVRQGEVFGFLGPNGAGKTTTIRLLMSLLKPDRGVIQLFARAHSRQHPELRERIGYLPGEFRPYGEMTAGRFLNYMARYRTRPPQLRTFLCEQLQFTSGDFKRVLKHLSHGNRQKVGLISALEHGPDLAILDEPTIGLDPLMQAAFYEIIRFLKGRGTTLFLSSHVLSEVETVCDRVALIRGGRMVAQESIDDLKRTRPRRLILNLYDDGDSTPTIPGATLLSRDGRRIIYVLDGDVREVLPRLSGLPVQDFFLPEPDLQDVFMTHYKEERI